MAGFPLIGLPDFRFDEAWLDLPSYTKKKRILEGEKPKRDFLLNLYFAKPDYEEPHRKMFYSTYMGVKMATLSGSLDVCCMNSRNPVEAVRRMGNAFLYILPAFVTYGTVAATVANLRRKDDHLNHFLAGCSLGCFYSIKMGSGMGTAFGVFTGILAVWLKHWHMFPENSLTKAFEKGEINLATGGEGQDFSVPSYRLGIHHVKTRTEHYKI